jgi:hypothetical protein
MMIYWRIDRDREPTMREEEKRQEKQSEGKRISRDEVKGKSKGKEKD